MQDMIACAYEIAKTAHSGQVDKGGKPYIQHVEAVAKKCQDADTKVVALLHDVIEDTPLTLSDLRGYGFSQEVLSAVDAITKRSGECRTDYLHRVKQNALARQVKIADLQHNADISRIPNPTKHDIERSKRYQNELLFLLEP